AHRACEPEPGVGALVEGVDLPCSHRGVCGKKEAIGPADESEEQCAGCEPRPLAADPRRHRRDRSTTEDHDDDRQKDVHSHDGVKVDTQCPSLAIDGIEPKHSLVERSINKLVKKAG